MRREDAAYFADVLKIWFPWLGTDEPAEGADTVQTLCDLYEGLRRDAGHAVAQRPYTLREKQDQQLSTRSMSNGLEKDAEA